MRSELVAFAVLAGAEAGFVSAQPVIQAVPERPRMVVDGYGEVKTPPDLATISYIARGEGSTSDDSVRAMTGSEARIEAALHGIDGGAEARTGDVKVTPVKSEDCKEQDDGSPQLSIGPCALRGYVSTQSVTVRTAAVKDAGTMVGLIGRGGGYDARISSFGLQDERPAQRQASAIALADASGRAAADAAAGHVTLGPVLSINASSRDLGQELIVTGARVMANRPAPNMPTPVTVKITPETITTSANVTVTYAIGQ